MSVAIGIAATAVVALAVVAILLLTGGAIALSDNAALIGALVALGGVFTTQLVSIALEDQRAQKTRDLEDERASEAALQKYFENVGQLIGEMESQEYAPGDRLSTVVRAQTLAVLKRLDGDRKGMVLQFLYESALLQGAKPVVSLLRADFRGANLSGMFLKEANLAGASLTGADFTRAFLTGASLEGLALTEVDLTKASLIGANLSEATVSGANLSEAILTGADLTGADLSKADVPSSEPLAWTIGSDDTRLPDGLERPTWWRADADERRRIAQRFHALQDAVNQASEKYKDNPEKITQFARDQAEKHLMIEGIVSAEPPTLPGTRLLWVDDNPENNIQERNIMEDRLRVKVSLAKSTHEALDKIRGESYDVIISDMGRAEEHGYATRAGFDLLDTLRGEGNETDFIIYAASNAPEHKAEARRRGAQGSTNSPQELFELVREAAKSIPDSSSRPCGDREGAS